MVEKRSMRDTSVTVRMHVAHRSENAGISNEKTGEIPVRRKPKDSVG